MRKLVIAIAIIAAAAFIGWKQFSAAPVARVVPDDGGTQWRPQGNPVVGAYDEHMAEPITFRTMHVSLNNSDQLWTATAPEQELAWVAEQDMYIPEGPTMDNLGQIYFSPLYPQEDVSLVVLDPANGKRLWTLPNNGDSQGSGAPLILDTPNEASAQTIYHATYHWAWAVTPQGKVLWHKRTGLEYEGADVPHAWGVNYVPQFDALTVLTANGKIAVLARTTGESLLAAPFELPGMPAAASARSMPSKWVMQRGDRLAEQRFGKMPLPDGLFTAMVRVIFGAGSEVSNFYAVDPNSGRLFVAATAPDEVDGNTDGVSATGALYALDLVPSGDQLALHIAARYDFDGGTGSTPTASNDGQRLYITDENGNVMALDRDLQEIWRINVGEQVAASVAVSADNQELYVVTGRDVFKLWDRGDHAEHGWRAQLDAFPEHTNVNALTPTITANGIAVSIGATREVGGNSLLMEAGFGLLDRDTGKLRGFVQGVEEGIAVTVVGADGGFAIAHSPVRRLGSKTVFGDSISPISGGIGRYKPSNYKRLAREASCAAADIATRSTAQHGVPGYEAAAQQWDDRQIQALMTQATQALSHTDVTVPAGAEAQRWCELLRRRGALNMATPTASAVRHFDVIVVGAGFAGIGAAIKLREAGFDFVVLEKAAAIGGVWRDNSYPDCACDIPSALYSFSFAPNPNWSSFFARQEEIRNYTIDTANKFGVMDSIRLNHELLRASWDQDGKVWELHTSAGDYSARFIIMACGPMHKPVTPALRGMETFTGASFHSAQWDHSCDLANKKVAVIGSGASAIQFVPAIESSVSELTLFQRTPPWVLPKLDFQVSLRWQRMFKRFPLVQSLLRTLLYWQFELLNRSLKHPRLTKRLQNLALNNIYRYTKDAAQRARLTPDYTIGCKRILQSNTWYRALARPHVRVVDSVAEVQGNTVIAKDGTRCEADVIIFATGFEVANPPIAERIVGASGVTLAEQWRGSPEVYLGTVAEDCPNCFLTFGPNLYTFSSAFVIIEAQLKYIMSGLTILRSKRASTFTVDKGKSSAYNEKLQASLQETVWNSGGCVSYFIDKNGRNSTNWPWTTFYMRQRMARFKSGDYIIE